MNHPANSDSISGRLYLSVSPKSQLYLKPNSAVRFAVEQLGRALILGRLDTADVIVNSDQVSRRHASLEHNGTDWLVSDTGSKLGTLLNRCKLPPHVPFRLCDGDVLQVGPVELLARAQPEEPSLQSSLLFREMLARDESRQSSVVAGDLNGSVSVLSEHSLSGLAQHRLRLLLKSAERFSVATSLDELAASLTEAAAKGTSAPRALLLDVSGGEWSVSGGYPVGLTREGELTISRSLVRAVLNGDIASLDVLSNDWSEAASIQTLNIRSALCVPVLVDEAVQAALYLDARGSERQLTPDAAAYCLALAQLAGMALANLRRAELAAREKAMQAELRAAREAQKNLMPAAFGEVGGVRYALEGLPGTIVAGDLFDVLPLDADRTMVMLGDVVGKGAGAGLIMATIQTYLTARAADFEELAELLESANRHFFKRFKGDGFVTLWIGVFDRADRSVRFVDAGHGHWRQLSGGEIRTIESIGGPPLGMIENVSYECDRLTLASRDRILLFSDGLIEQANSKGILFGNLNSFQDLAREQTPVEDVASLLQSHDAFRGEAALDDDLTIASIQFLD